MAEFGRKPSGADVGLGHVAANQLRGAIMGKPSSNGWGISIGARVGVQYGGGSSASWEAAIYGTSSASVISTKIAETGNGTTSRVMDYGGSGENRELALSGTSPMIYSKYTYALAVRGVSGNLALGQDHSGHIMHDRSGVSSFPTNFGATHVRPEGKPSIWLVYETNVAPNKPTGLSPTNGKMVSSTPTLAGDFRDANEVVGHFGVGSADKIKKYRFEVYNQAGTARLRDSGVLNATSAQQTARRVSWTPSSLGAGTYQWRLTVWDQFDTPSQTSTALFTINAGGTLSPELNTAHIDGTQGGYDLTNRDGSAAQPLQVILSWDHNSGLSTSSISVRLVDSSGTIVRGQRSVSSTIVDGGYTGATIGVGFLSDWGALTRGQLYAFEASATDTAGLSTPFARSPFFRVNANPSTPTSPSPASGAYSDPPQLSAILSDVNDARETLTATFAVRLSGDTGTGQVIPPERLSYSANRHRAQPDDTEMPAHGIYEWRVRATDPWGLQSDWTAWQTVTFATAPVVTITSPANNDELSTGTPTITFTADKAMTSASIVIREAESGYQVWTESWTQTGTSGTYTVPPSQLRNETDYVAEIEITSTEGLIGRETVAFSIVYEKPSALGPVTVDRIPGPFEDAHPSWWSRLGITMSPADTTQAPEDEWGGYIIYRTDLETGRREVLASPAARGDLFFVDKTPRSGTTYRYEAGYQLIKNGIDVVESELVEATGSVVLPNAVLTSLDDEDINIVLRYWESRDVEHVREQEEVPTWGSAPLVFMGAASYKRLTVTANLLDDTEKSYTSDDIAAEIERASQPRIIDGTPRPRLFLYRDPRRRIFVCTMAGYTESDPHMHNRQNVTLTLTEALAEVSPW